MSEPAHDTVYIAYHHTSWGNDPTQNVTDGRLFRTFGAPGTEISPPTWANITPGQVAWNRINDIEINKKNLKHIWVALGDVNYWAHSTPPADMTSKVYYSNNFGTNWVDISKGLPPLPVNKILYHDGTNRLYVATDVGVFTCDFSTFNPSATLTSNGVNPSVEWVCFNEGMPPCVVTDMEFNYCAGKLRVATFGRGMWETDILQSSTALSPIGNVTPEPTDIIASTPSSPWSTSKWITNGIRIKNNSTLTISGSGTVIHMPKNGSIIIEPGSKLILDGATITNDCDDCMWMGIQVLGDANQRQSSTYQGTIETKNGATIEHARFAITNGALPYDPAKQGGIINCTNTTFKNNKKSIQFHAYQNKDVSNLPAHDVSRFYNCTFRVNDDYKGREINYPFDCHASLWAVMGVRFSACEFYNDMSSTGYNNRKYGISLLMQDIS